MANRHESHCNHELAVCKHCDVAYCRKCNREWGVACHLNHYPNYWTTTAPWSSVPWGNTTVGVSNTSGPSGSTLTTLKSSMTSVLHAHSS